MTGYSFLCIFTLAIATKLVSCMDNHPTENWNSHLPEDRHNIDFEENGHHSYYQRDENQEEVLSEDPVIVTTVLETPYMMIKPSGVSLPGNDRYEGLLADMLQDLSRRAKFTYVIRICQDGLHGNEGENGTWTGMIGKIQQHEADLAAGAITISPRRQKIVLFTEPYMTFQSSAVLRRSARKRSRNPRSKPPRMRTLRDLHHSDMQYGVIRGSLTAAQFENASDPLLQQMWLRMVNAWPPAFVYNTQEGVQRAEHENYAFITDEPLADYVTARKPCALYKTANFLDIQQYAFAINPSDRLSKEVVDMHIREMQGDGTIGRLRKKWWVNECDRKREVKEGHEKVKTKGRTTMSPWRYATAAETHGLRDSATHVYFNLVNLYIYSLLALILMW